MDPHVSLDRFHGAERPLLDEVDADDGQEYSLAPVNGMSRDEMEAKMVDPNLLKLATAPPASKTKALPARLRFRFSLQHIFWAMTFAAVTFAAARYMPFNWFVFFVSVIVLGVLWIASRSEAEDPVIPLVIVGAVTVYMTLLLACRALFS